MKAFVLLILMTLTFGLAGYSQSATLTSDYKLLIPTEPKVPYSISKTDMGKVVGFASKLGEIKSYNISYMLNGSYYSKNVANGNLEELIRNKYINCGAGTKLFMEDVMIKSYTDATQIKVSCVYILTE